MAAHTKPTSTLTGHFTQNVAEHVAMQEAYGKEEDALHEFYAKGAVERPVNNVIVSQRGSARSRATPRSARSGMTTARTATSVTSRLTAIEELRSKKEAIEAELAKLDKRIAAKTKAKVTKAERPFAAFPKTHRDANKTTTQHFY